MALVFGETKEFRRHAFRFRIKCAPFLVRFFLRKTDRRQDLFVEFLRVFRSFTRKSTWSNRRCFIIFLPAVPV